MHFSNKKAYDIHKCINEIFYEVLIVLRKNKCQ